MLEKVLEGIRHHGMPEISIAPQYGKLLTLLTMAGRTQDALEIGALGGYSGICIARGLVPGGKLLSLELDESFASVAKQHMTEAGFGDAVEYRLGEALPSLEKLNKEGARFDFFFIDADKVNYPNYLEWAIRLARPGALIVGDNTLMRGRVADPNVSAGSVQAMRRFNEQIATDPRLDSTLLPAYDGLAIARVKG
jgi:caffeoyl-CoA O-methyltransferase